MTANNKIRQGGTLTWSSVVVGKKEEEDLWDDRSWLVTNANSSVEDVHHGQVQVIPQESSNSQYIKCYNRN